MKLNLPLQGALNRNKMALGRDPYGEKRDSLLELADGWIRSKMRNIYEF